MDRRTFIATGAALAASTALPAIAAPVADVADSDLIMPVFDTGERTAVDNTLTYVYRIMTRVRIRTSEDGDEVWTFQSARVGSDTYNSWLAETPPANGIPPHIQFGGAVVAGSRDPLFKAKWEERTRAAIATGEIR